MEPTRQSRHPESIHLFSVTDADVGMIGVVSGAKLLEWIDGVAFAVAEQWSGRQCVTASMGNFHLDRPIAVGELVELRANLVYTGCSSMHVLITIRTIGPSQRSSQTAQCATILVAVDEGGSPVQVQPWVPVTMLEMQRHRQARARARMRQRIESVMGAESCITTDAGPRITRRCEGAMSAGRVMRWIDEAAAVCGADWINAPVITSYIAGIRFLGPIQAGQVVGVASRLIHTGPRSVHVSIHVTTDDAEARLLAHGIVVVVSLDEQHNACRVPGWQPISDDDCRLDEHARHLIELRQFIEPFTATAVFMTGVA